MGHFYAGIQGNRGEATRMGTAKSGIYGHIRGWHVGAKIYASHSGGIDTISVYKTSGSNGDKPDELIACYSEDENE